MSPAGFGGPRGGPFCVLTRRSFLVAGGLTLAGHLLPAGLRRRWEARDAIALPRANVAPPVDSAESEADKHEPVAEIAMRSAEGGRRVWFEPVAVRLPPGGLVRWVLAEGVHTATAFHPDLGELPRGIPEGARPFDSGYLMEAGATFEARLKVEGVYDYFCRPHLAAGMVGRILVAAPDTDPETLAPRGDWERADAASLGLPAGAVEALRALPSVAEIVRLGGIGGSDAGP